MGLSLHRSGSIVAMAERRIARQRVVVDRLAARSLPTQHSITLLKTMESVLETLRRSHELRLAQVFSQNRVLRALPPQDFKLLESALEPVAFSRGDMLARPGEPTHRIYFVERGVVSVIGTLDDRQPEIAMVGREGMVGTDALVPAHSAFGFVAQDDGEAITIGPNILLEAVRENDRIRDVLQRYSHTLQLQVSEAALSGSQSLLRRLARWLLMYHDRIDGDEIVTTHEAIADLLNVRRAGVTEALHELEGRKLVKSMRGHIRIVWRPGLVALAGGIYGLAAEAIGRLLPELAPPEQSAVRI